MQYPSLSSYTSVSLTPQSITRHFVIEYGKKKTQGQLGVIKVIYLRRKVFFAKCGKCRAITRDQHVSCSKSCVCDLQCTEPSIFLDPALALHPRHGRAHEGCDGRARGIRGRYPLGTSHFRDPNRLGKGSVKRRHLGFEEVDGGTIPVSRDKVNLAV